jgi:hypothetical protein
LQSIAKKHDILLSSEHLEYLKRLTNSQLLSAVEVLLQIKHRLSIKKTEHLLLPVLGSIFQRALALEVRKQGGKITSFMHGGGVGLYNTSIYAFSEFVLADEFVTYTSGSAELFGKIKKSHPSPKSNKVVVKSSGNPEYAKWWKEYKNRPLPEKIKKVMIVGHPHNQWRKPWTAGLFSPMRLDLELNIVKILNEAGYEIMYKAHPDRTQEVRGIFEKQAEVRLTGYIQDYLDEIDAFLFTSIKTTAFSFALCTNKPIVAFEMDRERFKPFPEALELLKKRCSFVQAGFDKDNRIVFNKEQLLNALAQRIEQPNIEFIKTYMLP